MALDRRVERLVFGFQAANTRDRARVVGAVLRSWESLPDYFDRTVNDWVGTVGPLMEGAQASVAASTDAYLTAIESLSTGEATEPAGIPADVVSTESLRGVSSDELWRRPAKVVYRALEEGHDMAEAARRGGARARQLASTNLELAHTHAAQHSMKRNTRVVGYRRVTRGGISCGLCLLAATQRYRRGDLMPIHPGCHCTVASIIGKKDPGHVIAPGQLEAIHDRIAEFGVSTRLDAESAKQLLIEHDHGEIGPVLGRRGESYTVPKDIQRKAKALKAKAAGEETPRQRFERERLEREARRQETGRERFERISRERVDHVRGILADRFQTETLHDAVAATGKESATARDLYALPDSVLERAANAGVRVLTGDGKVAEFNEYRHLGTIHPRGWPEDATWKDVGGMYDRNAKTAVVGYSGRSRTALHEFGHAMDLDVPDVVESNKPTSHGMAWWRLHKRLATKTTEPYFTQPGDAGLEEAFAESFAMIADGDRKALLGEICGGDDELADDIIRFFERQVGLPFGGRNA